MKNKEKYAKEIIEAAISAERICVNKHTGEIADCYSVGCRDCLFNRSQSNRACVGALREWANAECKEPKRFTDREKAFVKLFPLIRYIARDKNGDLYMFASKPVKCGSKWEIEGGYAWWLQDFMCLNFNAIQWEDEEPTSREEILGDLEMTVTFGINEDKEDEAAHFGIKEDPAAKGWCENDK